MAQCVETNEHGYRCVLEHLFQNHVDALGREWPSTQQYCGEDVECAESPLCECRRDELHAGECRCEHWSLLRLEPAHGPAKTGEAAPAASASPAWEEAGFSSESAYDDYVRWLNDPRAGGG